MRLGLGEWLDLHGAKLEAASPTEVYFRQLGKSSALLSSRLIQGRCDFQSEVRVEVGADSVSTFRCAEPSALVLEADGQTGRLFVQAATPSPFDGGHFLPCSISPINFGRSVDAGFAEVDTTVSVRMSLFLEEGSECVISLDVVDPAGAFSLESTSTTTSSGTRSRSMPLSPGGIGEFKLSFTPHAFERSYPAELVISANGTIIDQISAIGRSAARCPMRGTQCPLANLRQTYLSTDSSLYLLSDGGSPLKLADFRDIFQRPVSMKDIGILGDGSLLGVGGIGNGLFLIDPETGHARLLHSFSQNCNGLDTLVDGGILIGGSATLFQFNLETQTETPLALFATSGDVASDGENVFASSPSQAGTELIRWVNLTSGSSGIIVDTGLRDGWGLTLSSGTLTMFTGRGESLDVSLDAGAIGRAAALPGVWTGAARRE
ncbi:MAG: hypothetical protein Q8N23_23745 [Archangium sp.]|nr:hypothetical protein [Archangium sp.]MDP3569745.1 hypothetical protein [Archangium sp.]